MADMKIDPAHGAKHRAATIDGSTLRVVPTPKVKLQTLDDVRVEMARVYRDARSGKRDTADASRMVFMLTQISKMIELAAIEHTGKDGGPVDAPGRVVVYLPDNGRGRQPT